MRAWWARVRWADVVVGVVAWSAYALEWALLVQMFPSTPPGCVETTWFSCWDLRAPIIGALSAPVWYSAWALSLRPCRWPLRWATPLAVSWTAYQLWRLGGWRLDRSLSVAVLVISFLVAAAVMSAVNAAVEASDGRPY